MFEDSDEVLRVELDDLKLLEDFAELNETEVTEETETICEDCEEAIVELLMLDKLLLLDKTVDDFEEEAATSDSV
jgi:hypothetical protein